MQDLVLIFQVIAGIFAVYGFCEFVRRFIDVYVINKAGAVCKLVLYTTNEDAEYAVRFAESRFLSGDYADFFDELQIAKSVDIDCETFTKLQNEFRNISRE